MPNSRAGPRTTNGCLMRSGCSLRKSGGGWTWISRPYLVRGTWDRVAVPSAGHAGSERFIKRFNRTYPTEVFSDSVFESLDQVRKLSAEWLQSYIEERPHDTLAGILPAAYRAQLEARSSPLPLYLDGRAYTGFGAASRQRRGTSGMSA